MTTDNPPMVSALEWYGERASSLASALNGMALADAMGQSNRIEAILVELSLDAGRRAAACIAHRTPASTGEVTEETVERAMKAFIKSLTSQVSEWTVDYDEGETLIIEPSGQEYFALNYPIRAAITAAPASRPSEAEPGVREAALAPGLEAAAKWHDAEAERIRVLALDSDEPGRMHDAQDNHISHAAAIRALSASPLTEEQPVAGVTDEMIRVFLDRSLKPEEISGADRQARISELLRWFKRLYEGSANPKWLHSHAAELAYFIATLPRSTTGGAK